MTTGTGRLPFAFSEAIRLGILNPQSVQQILALQQTNPAAYQQLVNSTYQKIQDSQAQNMAGIIAQPQPTSSPTPIGRPGGADTQYSTRMIGPFIPSVPQPVNKYAGRGRPIVTSPGVAPEEAGNIYGTATREEMKRYNEQQRTLAHQQPTQQEIIKAQAGGTTAITPTKGKSSLAKILAKLNRGEDLTPEEEKWIDDLDPLVDSGMLDLLQTAGQAGLKYKQSGAEFEYKKGQDTLARQQAIDERRYQLQQQLISQLLSNPAAFQALGALGGQTPANAIPGFRIPQTTQGTSAYGAIQRGLQGQGSAEEIGQGLMGLAGNPINPSSFYFDSQQGNPSQGGIPTFANFNRLQPGQRDILGAATGFSGAQQGLTEQMASVTPTLARRQRAIIPAGAGSRRY